MSVKLGIENCILLNCCLKSFDAAPHVNEYDDLDLLDWLDFLDMICLLKF